MIEPEFFDFSDEQWSAVKTVIRDELGLDADQIKRPVTLKTLDPVFIAGIPASILMQPLRERIQHAVSMYFFHSSVSRQRPRRAALDALRENTETLRAGIVAALTLPVGTKIDPVPHAMLLDGVDDDMLIATRDYFRKLIRNIDGQIEQAGRRGDNARKNARDQCWNELLAIWCELGGKPTGKAAATFLIAASKPAMGSAVPTLTSVVQWLERRQNKAAKTVRRRTTR
jgi:hypothetical protein